MSAVTYVLTHAVCVFIDVLQFAMIARALLSWFPIDDDNPIASFLYAITEPFIYPVRALFDRFESLSAMPIDIPFMVTYLILFVISSILSVYG